MALRGSLSQSFLRSKDLISFSEISHDKEGNNVIENEILKEALACDSNGNLIRHKSNIANILNKYGVLYRMVFNAMNMEQYTYDEIKEALDYLSEYINDLGVSGIVEFHAADKTQNSDHIHFWISSEDRLIYTKIAQEMVAMGYSNIEDVYIQKYEDNRQLDKTEYVNVKDMTLDDRFAIKPLGMEAGETLESINEMLSYSKEDNNIDEKKDFLETEPTHEILSFINAKYSLIVENINNLFKEVSDREDIIIERSQLNILEKKEKTLIVESCTLPKTEEINSILSRIEELEIKRNFKID